jgi:cytochrome P450
VFADDQYWRKSRRLLNPAFHIQVLNSYMNVFNEISVAASHEFEKAIEANNGGEFDIFHIMMGCAMDAICGNLRKDLFLKNNKLITSTHFLNQKLSWDGRN